jgi:signal transduction histidine kinase
VSLEILLMAAVGVLVERHQRRVVLEQTRLRALSLGTSLAALSEGYLLSYNFAKLEQAAEKLTVDDEDVIYTIVHLRDGKVAAYSEDRRFVARSKEGALQGTLLKDPISLQALQATAPWVQRITLPQTREPGYDVAIPVYLSESRQKWGTVRLGFSLQRAYMTVQQTRRDLFVLSLVAIAGGIGLAVVFSMRISQPIGQLVAKVQEIARGSYEQPIYIDAQDEIGYLARAFEQMRLSLLVHITGLAEEKDLLAASNQHLQETQQQLLYLAARVAHEVNNPLGIIKTAMRLLRDEPGEDVLNSELFQIVDAEVGRIARIVQEILAFSRPSVPDASVDVNALIHSLEHLLTPNLQQKGIALKLLLEPALPHVRISADHLTQVLLNIVRNAEDAMPEGGQLTMQTTRSPAGVEISITDTGCGISAEDISYLFDPFFTTKGQGPDGGTGLGLAVSYGIIHNAKGAIEVESELRKGSTFRVSLPACQVSGMPCASPNVGGQRSQIQMDGARVKGKGVCLQARLQGERQAKGFLEKEWR